MSRKSNTTVAIAILIAMAILATSCSQEPSAVPDGKAEVYMEILSPVEEKLLEVWAPGKVKSFVYKATPGFVQDGDLTSIIVGEQKNWTPVTFQRVEDNVPDTVGHLKAVMGYYQPGRWEIEIMALNANGNPVYYGSTGTVYLNAGESNGFIVPLHGVTSIGESASIDVTFTGPRTSDQVTDSPRPSMKIKWLDGTERTISTGWTSTNASRGTVLHTIHVDNLPAGETDITFILTQADGAVVTSETAAVLLVNGETSTVEGSIETGEYMDPSFDITEDESEIEVVVRAESGATLQEASPDGKGPQVFEMELFTKSCFSYTPSGAPADKWRWYINGDLQLWKEDMFIFNETIPGMYQVTACVWRGEKTASEDFIVIVKPKNVT